MRFFLYVAAGLLVAGLAISLFLNRWDVLIGFSVGLMYVIAQLVFGGRANGANDQAPKWPSPSATNSAGLTTYYYDEDDPTAADSAHDVGVQPSRTANEDEGEQQR